MNIVLFMNFVKNVDFFQYFDIGRCSWPRQSSVALMLTEFAHTFYIILSLLQLTVEGVGRFDNPVTKSAISSWYIN